jgi:hypothetical protein
VAAELRSPGSGGGVRRTVDDDISIVVTFDIAIDSNNNPRSSSTSGNAKQLSRLNFSISLRIYFGEQRSTSSWGYLREGQGQSDVERRSLRASARVEIAFGTYRLQTCTMWASSSGCESRVSSPRAMRDSRAPCV